MCSLLPCLAGVGGVHPCRDVWLLLGPILLLHPRSSICHPAALCAWEGNFCLWFEIKHPEEGSRCSFVSHLQLELLFKSGFFSVVVPLIWHSHQSSWVLVTQRLLWCLQANKRPPEWFLAEPCAPNRHPKAGFILFPKSVFRCSRNSLARGSSCSPELEVLLLLQYPDSVPPSAGSGLSRAGILAPPAISWLHPSIRPLWAELWHVTDAGWAQHWQTNAETVKIFAAKAKLANVWLHCNVYSPSRHAEQRSALILLTCATPQVLEVLFCFYFIPHSALTNLLSGTENPSAVPLKEHSCTKCWWLSSPNFIFLT